jgi:hypothetical protein
MSAEDRYRQFAAQSPTLPLCFQPWYLDAVTEEGEWKVLLAEDKGEIQGVWPYFLKRKFGIPYIAMPHFTKWMGPWLVPDADRRLTEEHRLLDALLAQLPTAAQIQVNCHPDLCNWLPLYWKGFRQTTRYTYTLDITDLARVQEGINRNIARNIKKAEAVVEISREGSLEAFFEINRLSFLRQKLEPTFTLAKMRRHLNALEQHNAVRLFFARDAQGRLHSAAALTWDQRRAYYHLSGDDPALRSSGAGILLIWEAIQFAHETLQLEIFDFEGSMMPSVEAVRRQFGAVQQPYFQVWRRNWLQF